MRFVAFMRSPIGRLLSIGLGLALMAIGLMGVGGTLGFGLALAGIVPILAGVFNVCLAAPLFGLDLQGQRRVSLH